MKTTYHLTLIPAHGKCRTFQCKTGIKTRGGTKRHAREWAGDVRNGVIRCEERQDTGVPGVSKNVTFAVAEVTGGTITLWR